MRLIDADKIRYIDLSDGQVPDGVWCTFLDNVEKLPTVEAIPVKWLRTWFTKKASLIGITLMSEIETDWERENEGV